MLALPGTAHPAGSDCIEYQEYFHWAGTGPVLASVLGVSGDVLCAANEIGSFYTLDISAAPSMTPLGSATIPERVEDMAVSGDLAFVSCGIGAHTFVIVSIADPHSPSLLGTFTADAPIRGISVQGDLAFLAAGELVMLDVGDPSAPGLVSTFDVPDFALDVVVADGHAFVACNDAGVQVVDVSIPESPQIVRQYIELGSGLVAFAGEVLASAGITGVVLLDVSDPSSPQYLGELNPGVLVSGIGCSGNLVCVIDLARTVFTVDVSTPFAPMTLGRMPIPFEPENSVIDGSHIYVADRGPIEVLDISNPRSPEWIGAVTGLPFSDRVVGVPGYALLAARSQGLKVVDCADPSSPILLDGLPARDRVNDVSVNGLFAYLADGGLRVVDVSNPASPLELSFLAVIGKAEGVACSGDLAVLTQGTTGVELFDVTTPGAPIPGGSVDTPGNASGVEIVGDHAFIADGAGGLQIVNLDDPDSPFIEGAVALPANAFSLALRDERAYVVTGNGLAIVDVSDPSAPVVSNQMILLQRGMNVVIQGSKAYVAVNGGAHVLDLTNPVVPEVEGTIPMSGFGGPVGVFGNLVFASSGDLFAVFPVQCQGPTPVIVSGFTGHATFWQVELSWHTSFEEMHDGFHVDRSRSLHGGWRRLTHDLVRGESPYSFVDKEVEAETTYFYRLAAVDWSGEETLTPPIMVKTPSWLSAVVMLENAAPNPFAMETGIRFTLRSPTDLRLSIFDVAGRLVRNVASGRYESGAHRVEWNGSDERGRAVAPGTYFVRLASSGGILTKKVARTK